MSCFEEGAEPLVVDFHEHEPPGCQKKILELFLFLLLSLLAGPALFRGRIRALGKCTDVVASSQGRLNLDSVRLIV